MPDVVTWTPEKVPFFRLTETALSMPRLAPEGKTLITVDIGAEKGDEFWQMDDETLGELCVENLKPIIQNVRNRYLGCRVLKTPIAYPVFLREYEAERQQFMGGTGVENLYGVGRNGEFSHIFMEDVHHRTEKKMSEMMMTTAQESVKNADSSVLSKEQLITGAFGSLRNNTGGESGTIESALAGY